LEVLEAMTMPTNTATIRVGRLLEVRIDAGYRTTSEVDDLFDRIGAEIAKRPLERYVAVVDWRRCPVMSPVAAERVVQRIALTNSRTERSAALASQSSPVAVLQFVRVIRSAHLPDRKLFFDADEVANWLARVLSPAETRRVREFLGESPEQEGLGTALGRGAVRSD
jgi:hypothetical protein